MFAKKEKGKSYGLKSWEIIIKKILKPTWVEVDVPQQHDPKMTSWTKLA